ncbi:hypothetical protein CWO91_03405 [Bradyrhizobium genosp. SA-3]|nr:hypothetical protein CWO91_03405 [Bradyrhizobium genosp. SA-3]
MISWSRRRIRPHCRRSRPNRAFSSEVATGSRKENASRQEIEPLRFHRNGSSRVFRLSRRKFRPYWRL